MLKENRIAIFCRETPQSKWLVGSGVVSLLWYVSLFPGRIGYDPVQSVILMRNGESTDWWTSIYFWFLRITTFYGQSIWLASLISMIILYLSMLYFIYSFPENKKRIQKVAFFICLSPLFGNFAVNINHDIFISAGTLLLVGISLRHYLNSFTKIDRYIPYFAISLLMNAKTGYFIILTFLMFKLLTSQRYLKLFSYVVTALALFFLSSIGITKTSVPMHFLPALADLKCVAQHPEARISNDEWNYLKILSPEEKWKEPITCSSMDVAIGGIRSEKLKTIDAKEFIENYVSIASKNPAIIIQTHLQRSSVALPPPFFQGPENQVDRNINNPVGLNTNTALQLGPIVLHPSIDDEELKIHNPVLKTLESLALLPSFVINQASWFWGWGGLWLWPIYFYLITRLRGGSLKRIVGVTYPLIATHLVLFLVGPIPAPRYVMATILIGNAVTLFLISEFMSKTKLGSDVN